MSKYTSFSIVKGALIYSKTGSRVSGGRASQLFVSGRTVYKYDPTSVTGRVKIGTLKKPTQAQINKITKSVPKIIKTAKAQMADIVSVTTKLAWASPFEESQSKQNAFDYVNRRANMTDDEKDLFIQALNQADADDMNDIWADIHDQYDEVVGYDHDQIGSP